MADQVFFALLWLSSGRRSCYCTTFDQWRTRVIDMRDEGIRVFRMQDCTNNGNEQMLAETAVICTCILGLSPGSLLDLSLLASIQ